MKSIISIIILVALGFIANAQTKITFSSFDGLTITADEYTTETATRYIVLCHQAGSSRGEYTQIAKRFNKLGFNCLAVDLRSGGEANGVKNETAEAATTAKKSTEYIDSEKDINAAIEYAFNKSNHKNVILLGSSYSASLALKIGKENDKVSAIIAFSPGEYFGNKLNIANSVKSLNKPVWVTCTKKEVADVTTIMNGIVSKNKMQINPTGEGIHGAKALWKDQAGNEEYWVKIIPFMDSVRNL